MGAQLGLWFCIKKQRIQRFFGVNSGWRCKCFFLGLFFHPEDGGAMFLGWLLTDITIHNHRCKAVPETGRGGPQWDVEFSTSARRWRWGCQSYAQAGLYSQEDSWYSFLLEAKPTPGSIVRLDGLGQLKNPVTSLEIEPATFRLAAYCLNQLGHRCENPKSLGSILNVRYEPKYPYRWSR
jgi:hypothetical protein